MPNDQNLTIMKRKVEAMIREEARSFLRRLAGPPRRELAGKEYDHIWTLLQLLEPVAESNNQRTWTSEYRLNNVRYDVTYGIAEIPVIEEVGVNEQI